MTSHKGKVLVAMSGGVDSSVAAALLLRDGYEVVGCFMRLGSPGESLDELQECDAATLQSASQQQRDSCEVGARGGVFGSESRGTKTGSENRGTENGSESRGTETGSENRVTRIGHQGCCSINDAADARLVAAKLDIPFYVCNFKKDFRRIIDYFVGEYNAGRTPNPCVRCNDWLKFGKLHEYAKQIDADFVASGHYARIEWRGATERPATADKLLDGATKGEANGHARPMLLRGVDHDKDQSYVLFGAPRERLREMLFPIGALRKSRVREIARELDLPVFDKPDSQEICFVPDNDYAGLVKRRSPSEVRAGAIVDTAGRTIGEHEGHQHYTIGQRRGIGIARSHPLYVIDKNAESNTIVVGEREALEARGCIARETNWLIEEPCDDRWIECAAKIRYNAKPQAAKVRRTGHDELEVEFHQPQFAIAPGQAVVCYDGEIVLCGGWIVAASGAG